MVQVRLPMPQALTAPDASDTKANEKVIAMPILSAFVSQFSIDTISVVYEHVGPDPQSCAGSCAARIEWQI